MSNNMKATAVISLVVWLVLCLPSAIANDQQSTDISAAADNPAEAAMRTYAARIAVVKLALQYGKAAQARVELSLTAAQLRGWEYDYLLSEAMNFGKERHQSKQVCDAVEFGASGLAFTHDGRLLFPTTGGTIAWDYRLNNSEVLLPTTGDACVAVSVDGTQVATGGDDGKVQLWDAASGEKRFDYEGHSPLKKRGDAAESRRCVAIALSPDGTLVASAAIASSNSKGNVKPHLHLWSPKSTTSVTRRQLDLSDDPSNGAIRCVAFAPDGQLIATGGPPLENKETVRLWDAKTGKQVRGIKGHEDDVISLAFSPQGDRLVTASKDNSIAVWDVSSGREVFRKSGLGSYPNVTYSPDGKRIVTGDWSQRIRFWDAKTGVEVFSIDHLPSGVRAIAFSPDGKQLAAAGDRKDSTFKPTIWSSQVDQFPAMISREDESVKQRDDRKSAKAAAAIKALLKRLVSLYDGEYPKNDSALSILDSIHPVISRVDPWGKPYRYRYDPKANAGQGAASCGQTDPTASRIRRMTSMDHKQRSTYPKSTSMANGLR